MKQYITLLRFPLAVLVVLIHAYRSEVVGACGEAAQWWEAFVSHGLTRFAVPLFFVMSGYLFFQGLRKWDTACYAMKLQRRARSLLLPYLVWNLLALLLYWGQTALPTLLAGGTPAMPWHYFVQRGGLHIFWDAMPLGTASTSPLGLHFAATGAPLLVPLWFVRDLMANVLLVPLTFFLLKYLRGVWVVALLAAHVMGLFPSFLSVSLQSVAFFTLGAWCTSWQREASDVLAPFTIPALAVAVAAIWAEYWGGYTLPYGLLSTTYVVSAMVAAIGIARFAATMLSANAVLAESSFFVYAGHIIVLSPLQMAMAKYFPHHGFTGQLALYFLLPLTAILVTLGAYAVARKTRWVKVALGA